MRTLNQVTPTSYEHLMTGSYFQSSPFVSGHQKLSGT